MSKIFFTSLLLICFFCFSNNYVRAQFEGKVYIPSNAASVKFGTHEKTLAWGGGLNIPQYATADLNKDGILDIVVYQSDNSLLKTFINKGTNTEPKYEYEPKYQENFPPSFQYVILKDYNGDGIADLFDAGGAGFRISKGYYNVDGMLSFTPYKSLFYNNDKGVIGEVNAVVNPGGDIPSIVDVDGDGDLDFLSYTGDGYVMYWYQNLQVENGLHKDSIVIRLADKCWGKMRQLFTRTHELGYSCDNSKLARIGYEDELPSAKKTDGGNTPYLIDMDGDGDFDVLDGHRAHNQIVYLENGRNLYGKDTMIYQDTSWSPNGHLVDMAQWAAITQIDVDGDGKLDLIISPSAANVSENLNCSQLYKNTGTSTIPSFTYQNDSFFVSEMIDVGSNSYPFFYDYDKDGKPDLFIGTKGYYQKTTGTFLASVMYLKNTSEVGKPSFELVSKDFNLLSTRKFNGAIVTFGDIDNDGIDDMLIGHINGTISYIKNFAASNSVTPVLTAAPKLLNDINDNEISVIGWAAPLVYDIDKDGKKDLIIGNTNGKLFYYKNMSSGVGEISFMLENNNLGNIKVDPEPEFTNVGYSTPYIGKIDNSPNEYLLVGSRTGRISRYTGFQDGNVFMPFTRIDSVYSSLFQSFLNSVHYSTAPAVADIDGDGKYEMLVGNLHGGLFLFQQDKVVSVKDFVQESIIVNIFPNPSNSGFVNVAISPTLQRKISSITIMNILGQTFDAKIINQKQTFATISIDHLPNGIYNIVIQVDNQLVSKRFLKNSQ
jgi:hypothetical protein